MRPDRWLTLPTEDVKNQMRRQIYLHLIFDDLTMWSRLATFMGQRRFTLG